MDDLEFRRRAYAEPNNKDETFLEKKNSSEENTQFVDELQHFDKKITDAMNIQPPEGLAERIMLSQKLDQHNQQKHRIKYGLSIAASVLLIFGLLFSFILPTQLSVDQEVLAHIYEELNHLDDHQNKNIIQVNNLLADYGAEIKQDIGKVNYLGSCDIANKKGIHIVLQGETGPVTVMMMPKIDVANTSTFSDNRFKGTIIQTAKGSMAIVGEKNESLDNIKQILQTNLSWVI